MIVAIQGAPGSFSAGAAHVLLGVDIELMNCDSFDELFAAVVSGRAERGVVPIRNTIVGLVYDNAVRAQAEPFAILGQLSYHVRQCLIARAQVPVDGLRRVASHPVALKQCTKFFDAHPECQAVEVSDTGAAVRGLMLGTLAVDAVIASANAADIYGATVLREGVDDATENFTEFVLIACTNEFSRNRAPNGPA